MGSNYESPGEDNEIEIINQAAKSPMKAQAPSGNPAESKEVKDAMEFTICN